MNVGTWEAIGVIIAIAGAVLTGARYLWRLEARLDADARERRDLEKRHQEALDAEKDRHGQQEADLRVAVESLKSHIVAIQDRGLAVMSRKSEIDELLHSIMRTMNATRGSIYVPVTGGPGSEVTGLAFLSIRPDDREAASLRRKIIPLESMAGRCFTSGTPRVSKNAAADPTHFRQADTVSGVTTQDMLTSPVRANGSVVGVIQLLNRSGGQVFTEADIVVVESLIAPAGSKIRELSASPESLELLGIVSDKPAEHATVVYCDITRSSTLFRELNAEVAIQHINEFFERACDIALRYGATIDKYIGDGVILRFNVPRPVSAPEESAVRTALEIRDSFQRLRADWRALGDHLEGVFVRIGMSSGKVYRAIVGHPQVQHLTLMGQPVNVAVNLCDIARRDDDVIVIDSAIHDTLAPRLEVAAIPPAALGKAAVYTNAGYEVHQLRN